MHNVLGEIKVIFHRFQTVQYYLYFNCYGNNIPNEKELKTGSGLGRRRPGEFWRQFIPFFLSKSRKFMCLIKSDEISIGRNLANLFFTFVINILYITMKKMINIIIIVTKQRNTHMSQ